VRPCGYELRAGGSTCEVSKGPLPPFPCEGQFPQHYKYSAGGARTARTWLWWLQGAGWWLRARAPHLGCILAGPRRRHHTPYIDKPHNSALAKACV
jgi:hypothetical protein